MRNMNLRMPSRRPMQAESEMAMVLPRFLGCEMRAKIMPMVMASMIMPTSDWMMMSQAAPQHEFGPALMLT